MGIKITVNRHLAAARRNWKFWALLFLFLIALVLRLWGINFGLPFEYHVDEVQYVRQAASMGREGLKPVWWNNPPFLKYVLLVEYGGLYIIGRLIGWYNSVSDFGVQSQLDPTRLYLLGRATSAVFGATTVFVCYAIGRIVRNWLVGIVAAWFLATCFLHARDSHFAVNDIAATFFVTLTVFAAVMVYMYGNKPWYILAGISLGIGFAVKYTAVFVAISVLVAHLYAKRKRKNSKNGYYGQLSLILFFITAIFAAVLASPYFIFVPKDVFTDAYSALVLAGRSGFDGWQIDAINNGYFFYLKTLKWGLGSGLLILAISGIIRAVWRRKPVEIILLSFPVLYFLVAGNQQQYYFARFILPIIPSLLVISGLTLWDIGFRLTKGSRYQAAFVLVSSIALTIVPLVNTIRFDYLLTQEDTRTLAKIWIEQNIESGASIAVDWPFYGPPLTTNSKMAPLSTRSFNVVEMGGFGLGIYPLDWYKVHKFDYIITSSFVTTLRLVDSERDLERANNYANLTDQIPPLIQFQASADDKELPFIFDEIYGPAVSLWERQRTGPTITIFKLNN